MFPLSITSLLHVQAAVKVWSALAGSRLGSFSSASRRQHQRLQSILQQEAAFLAAAFRLRVDEDDEEGDHDKGDGSSSSSSSSKTKQRLARQLRGMGRRAALARSRAEALVARLFLRQAAVAEALRLLGDGDEEEDSVLSSEQAGLLVVRLQGLLGDADIEEEEDPAQQLLLRAVGVDVARERAALQSAMASLLDPCDAAAPDEDEEEEDGMNPASPCRWTHSAVIEAGRECCREEEEEAYNDGTEREYATSGPMETGGASQGHRCRRGEPDDPDPVLEVFEAVAADGPWVQQHQRQRQRRADAGAGPADHDDDGVSSSGGDNVDHGALLGELGRVLKGRRWQRVRVRDRAGVARWAG